MHSESLNPNVQDLQTDVIDLLGQISSLMNRASTALSSDSAAQKYGEFRQEVDEEADKVKNLELRMAIVAPMKAGKSTIINAIVGQEILPSRNAAMTTLPTGIIFDAQLTEPTLILSPEILSVFQETLLALRNKIKKSRTDWMQEKVAQYPHLMDLLQEITDPVGFPIRTRTSGREEIIKTLTGVNDIIRLCSLIDPSLDPLAQLTEVPYIKTPFCRSQGTQKSEKLGNLVIIDTPGPNEAGETHRLTVVVEEQLRQSSIVLIVLDFTQLKTKAAEEVKQDVQKVIQLRGKENLYVLLNKIDQRSDNDMTPEQVRQFVAAEFGIGDSGNTERVFEIAAKWAFCATNFLLELEQLQQQEHLDIDIAQIKTARALAQQALGSRWEAKLKKASVDGLKDEAEYLWEESGFPPFLEKAIDALMESAAPRCMRSALNLSRNRLKELRDDVQLRSNAIAQDAEKLQHEVRALEADLEHLELCHSRLKEVDTIKTQLHSNLSDLLHDLKNTAKVSIETYFVDEEYQRAVADKTSWVNIKKRNIEVRQAVIKKLVDFENFSDWISKRTEWISKKIKSAVEYKSSGVFEFNSTVEAEEFASQAVTYAKQRADSLLSSVREQSRQEIERARTGLINFLEKETQPIIERARTRINEAFNVNLSLPQPTLESGETEVVKPRVKSQYRYVPQSDGERVVKKRKWRNWLWMVPVEVKETFKRSDKREDYYTVSLEELIAEINQSIEANIDRVSEEINKYLDEDFKQRIDVFFEDVDGYLRNYRDSLRQAQSDQTLSLGEKKKLVGELTALVPEATAQIEKADTYLERTGHLMQDK